MKYRERIADLLLKEELESMGAVLIEGPKACGKTTTGEQQARSVIYINDPSLNQQYKNLAQTDITQLLTGGTPRLIDEWQEIPRLWDAVRFAVDHREDDGQFILTGSAVPVDISQITHTGTGRIGRLKMRPMSLWESGESSGEVSLEDMFSTPQQIRGTSTANIEDIAYYVCRGGWPKAIDKHTEKAALRQVNEYYKSIIHSDITRAGNFKVDQERAERIMRSYARNQGTQTSIAAILADIATNEASDISDVTVETYLSALRKIFVIEDMKAWNPNLKSKTAIRTAHTRYYTDPSVGVAALGLGPKDLINDMKTFGLFFEAMCIRDLRIYTDALDGEVYHYRDKNGLECDAVVHLRNGRFGLIEIKIGGDLNIDGAATNLLKLASNIDTDKMKTPSFCMVLIGVGQYAYRRADGVYVVPVTCLKN